MARRLMGIKGKLVCVFVLIKVLPLMVLAWFAWSQISSLGSAVREKTEQLVSSTKQTVSEVGTIATESSIRALDLKSREAIERLSTDTARQVAAFLYDRDKDLLQAATLEPKADRYALFLSHLQRRVTQHGLWKMNADGTAWQPAEEAGTEGTAVSPVNLNNSKEFHSRPADSLSGDEVPLYREMTFVDMNGREQLKIVTSDAMDRTLRDIRSPANTYCKAERYFDELKKLSPGEIYVSDVIGAYLPSPIIGPYTRVRAKALNISFKPEEAGYAGKENPIGKRFQGIVRWATPVVRGGKQIGWVTLALDHTHVMEFTDHILPTQERYTEISDASTGNYAFMWDYKGRNISHPRDYSIVGYDPETGEPAVPWLEESVYEAWKKSGRNATDFLRDAPEFDHQSLTKKPASELTRAGLVGLDGRYLNFAPQCTGWHNLTQHGGSGSFVIFWSGLWKLTTAATIPYYTGHYGLTPRGFGYVTIGANVDEFHLAATVTASKLETMITGFVELLGRENETTQALLKSSLRNTSRGIATSTALMILVVVGIAIVMATALTQKITKIIEGIRKLKAGDMDSRLAVDSNDEIGELCSAFNETSATVSSLVVGLKQAEERTRSIIENAIEGIYQSTLQGQYIQANPAFVHMLGYDSEAQMKEEINDISRQLYVDPRERDALVFLLRTHGSVSNYEFKAFKRDGQEVWLSTTVRAVYGDDGEIAYIEGMVGDITSRKKIEEAKRFREAAEARDQAKSVFLANMSHEIRTPMNAILGVAELLQEGCTDESQKALVSLLHSSGGHLLVLLNDILDVSQIEAGKIKLSHEVFNLRDIVKDIAALMSVKAQAKEIQLDYLVEPEVPALFKGDASRLRQVLLNLVGNAVKFTERGEVIISAGIAKRMGTTAVLTCSVRDTGEGIAPAKLEGIFDSFVQADASITRRHGGTGLGLSISRMLVRLMGGDIHVESEVGKGSTFTFTLSLETVDDASSEIRSSGEQESHGEWDGGLSRKAESRFMAKDVFKGRRILYVDDSESNRMLALLYLKNTGAVLDVAEDGTKGLEMVLQQSYDLILLDMELPGIDGYTLAGMIQKMPDRAATPIIALTANAMTEDRQRCLDAGCLEYIAKPMRKSTLLNVIGAMFEG